MEYQEIKQKKEKAYNDFMKECGVFWAFSTEQFNEGKTPLAEGEKYVSIGMGGFVGKNSVDKLIDGLAEIEKTFKNEIKEFKMREKHVLYELNNHEAFYTGSIEATHEALGDDYTAEEVLTVFKKHRAKKYARPTVESDYITINK